MSVTALPAGLFGLALIVLAITVPRIDGGFCLGPSHGLRHANSIRDIYLSGAKTFKQLACN
jgi:hypothetical protein